jgi:hypothetical protein
MQGKLKATELGYDERDALYNWTKQGNLRQRIQLQTKEKNNNKN